MREEQAQFRAVDRPAGPGDLLVVDYTLAIEGRDPSSQTGYQFVVGDKTVLPEIDAAIVGMRAGETRSVPFRFADDHRRGGPRGRGGGAPGQARAGEGEGGSARGRGVAKARPAVRRPSPPPPPPRR